MLAGATLYTADAIFPVTHSVIPGGGIVVENGKIAAVGSADELRTRFPDGSEKDFPGAVMVRGLVNAHTHLELTAIGGTIRTGGEDGGEFVDWVMRMIPAKRPVRPAEYAEAVRQGLNQLLSSGVTAVGDIVSMPAQTAEVARAFVDAPLRAVAYCEILHADPGMAKGLTWLVQDAVRRFEREFGNSTRLKAGLSPHSPYTVSEQLGTGVTEWAATRHVPMQMHAAESPAEREFFDTGGGPMADTLFPFVAWDTFLPPARHLSPITYLERHQYLRPDMTLIHGVEVSPEDLDTIHAHGCAVVHCPRSNATLHCNVMPLGKYLDAGVRVGLGTDSLASAPSLSMWDEMRAALEVHGQEQVDSATILRLATLGGADALGMADTTGSLDIGKAADFVVATAPTPAHSVDNLLTRTHDSDVRAVYIDGKLVHSADAE